jgi:hypothetical protein
VRIGSKKSILNSILSVGSVAQQSIRLFVESLKVPRQDLLERLSCRYSVPNFKILVTSDDWVRVFHLAVVLLQLGDDAGQRAVQSQLVLPNPLDYRWVLKWFLPNIQVDKS